MEPPMRFSPSKRLAGLLIESRGRGGRKNRVVSEVRAEPLMPTRVPAPWQQAYQAGTGQITPEDARIKSPEDGFLQSWKACVLRASVSPNRTRLAASPRRRAGVSQEASSFRVIAAAAQDAGCEIGTRATSVALQPCSPAWPPYLYCVRYRASPLASEIANRPCRRRR